MRPGCCLAAGLAAQLCDHKGESGWNLTKNGEAGMPAGSEMASLTAGACDPLVAAVNSPQLLNGLVGLALTQIGQQNAGRLLPDGFFDTMQVAFALCRNVG